MQFPKETAILAISADDVEFRLGLERLVMFHHVAFSEGEAPLSYRIPSDAVDVGIRNFG